MRRISRWKLVLLLGAIGSSLSVYANDTDVAMVMKQEQAFAASMAKRDFRAFSQFVDDHAIFFSEQPLVGKAQVLAGWQPYFQSEQAPFSWQPNSVQVTADGQLAFSSGPVFSPEGVQIATFNSVWRKQPDGQWRVVFDKGCRACHCQK